MVRHASSVWNMWSMLGMKIVRFPRVPLSLTALAICSYFPEKRSLLVVPANVTFNWKDEVDTFGTLACQHVILDTSNMFDHVNLVLISVSCLQFRKWLPNSQTSELTFRKVRSTF
jgi:hypothetical protein